MISALAQKSQVARISVINIFGVKIRHNRFGMAARHLPQTPLSQRRRLQSVASGGEKRAYWVGWQYGQRF
ncbi:hypothetical protein [uncultured Pelagimonas sp.]|uniref:hypothetical protein n=1 Tax=uncultured Pelagimonas sp. TaxID=1618102 RepID=UPI0026342D31|nr:hypothetical protein [uncultured Pelagimonas sp.]